MIIIIQILLLIILVLLLECLNKYSDKHIEKMKQFKNNNRIDLKK